MRAKYYTIHPRGFANEYTAVKVTTPEEDKALDEYWKNMDENGRMYKRTYKELQRMKAEEAWARRYDQAFSGYCTPEPITVTEFLKGDEW